MHCWKQSEYKSTGGWGCWGLRVHSHMSANIICLSIDPLFWCKSYTQWHCFYHSLHPLTPFFSKFQLKISNFLHAPCAFGIFCQFLAKSGKFSLKFDQIYTKWPIFFKVHTKKGPVVGDPTFNDPHFSVKSYTECPYFCSLVGTYPSLSSGGTSGLYLISFLSISRTGLWQTKVRGWMG